ncbi:MAG: class B sortase [Candidatus Gastranaerophilales bacterium]|nr:class B sortase [Candidatus Gastranaerophilales bacterium]
MTEESKKELTSQLIRWGRQGRKIRRLLALAAIFVLSVYYHSIAKRQPWNEKKSMENKKSRRRIRAFLLLILVVCLILTGQAYYQSVQHRIQQDRLKEQVRGERAKRSEAHNSTQDGVRAVFLTKLDIPNVENGGEQTEEEPVMLYQYAELYEENNDLVGWLSIDGMTIDYPVMQNEDDEYYLHHDFYGEDSKYGCLYVRDRADLDAGTNFIIYGHNMRDGSMFGDLDFYLTESFYQEHSVISFDTLYEERTYDIIAVFRSQIYREGDDVFKYYQFYEAETQEEFDEFYNNIKALSLYDTGVEAEFGDTFLTLSTCAYHVDDGRLVVVAKRRQ